MTTAQEFIFQTQMSSLVSYTILLKGLYNYNMKI